MTRTSAFAVLFGAALWLMAIIFLLRAPLMERIVSEPAKTRRTHRWIAASCGALGALSILIGVLIAMTAD